MTEAEIIDGVLAREGGYVDDASDSGGPTSWGITARVLGEWRQLGRPATRAEVQAMTANEARAIYQARYVRPFASIADDGLRAQLVDVGVLSGPRMAIQMLQRTIRVEPDGVLGAQTHAAVAQWPAWVVSGLLVGARCQWLSALAEQRPKDRKYLRGWVTRAVSFWPNPMT